MVCGEQERRNSRLAGHELAKGGDERVVAGRRTALDVEIDTVQDGIAKGTRRAVPAKVHIPDRLCERRSLRVVGEADRSSSAADGEGDGFALGLAGLDVGRESGTVGHLRAGEGLVVDVVADVGEVHDRSTARAEELRQERDGDGVDGIILSRVSQSEI